MFHIFHLYWKAVRTLAKWYCSHKYKLFWINNILYLTTYREYLFCKINKGLLGFEILDITVQGLELFSLINVYYFIVFYFIRFFHSFFFCIMQCFSFFFFNRCLFLASCSITTDLPCCSSIDAMLQASQRYLKKKNCSLSLLQPQVGNG